MDTEEYTVPLNGPTESATARIVEMLGWLLVGMSGWWSSNVIMNELSFFISALPEGNKLGNLLAVSLQVGNIFPIIYKSVLCGRVPADMTPVVVFCQATAVINLLICAFFWQVLVHNHSVVLLFCSALGGGVGALSNSTFWAAASQAPAYCTRVMSIGMATGGLISMALVTLQLGGRPSGDPRFSPLVLYIIAAVIQIIMASFVTLDVWDHS